MCVCVCVYVCVCDLGCVYTIATVGNPVFISCVCVFVKNKDDTLEQMLLNQFM